MSKIDTDNYDARLAELDERQQLIRAVIHDLKQPARAVSFLEQFAREALDQPEGPNIEEAKEHLANIKKNAEDLLNLIQKVSFYFRLDRETFRPAAALLGEVLSPIVRKLRTRYGEDRTLVTTPDGLPVALMNIEWLQALLEAVLDNAFKFNVSAEIRVRIYQAAEFDYERAGKPQPDHPMTVLCFEDNGIGIEPQYREKVFTPLFRIFPRDVYPGSGMSLAACRKIAARAGGWLDLTDSSQETGITVRVCLPVLGE